MSNKHKKKIKRQINESESMDREIKWFVTIVLLAFAVIGAMPYFSMMLGGVVQYAEGAEFYIQPNDLEFVHHDGTGVSCPTVTGPSSADNDIPPAANEWYISDSSDAQGCYYPVYIFDEERVIPRVFDDAISLANRIWLLTDWVNPDWNSGDNIGGGVGCTAHSLNDADPRINATAAYDSIRSSSSIGMGVIGECESDESETDDNEIQRLRIGVAVEDYVNRDNSTYWAFGGRLGGETSSRDIADRGIDLVSSQLRLKATFQVPANYSNNWWQLQEHPMFINELGTPTGNQFSDNSPALIDSGFFGIDDTTFTMDTGLDAVERGQVVLFKQFNKTTIGERDIRVQGGIQSVDALGDTRLRIEVRDHPIQAGQTQFFGDGLDTALEGDVHDGQDYFHKNRPIKYINNGSLGVLDFEPTSLGAVEGFDFSLSPEWTHSTNDIFSIIIAVQDNSTTGSLIANITSVEIEDVINYNFEDINDLLFWEDGCSANFANIEPVGNSAFVQNDENCGDDLSNGLVNINNQTLTGAIAGTLSTPAAVTGLTVGVITDDSLILEWTHDGIDTTGYRIDRDDGSGLVEYIPNTAVGGPNGEGGLYENRFIDINYNVTNYPSRVNAFGLEENTEYSYRVCALNGDLVGTCSSTVSQTTPDSTPFWQIVEFDEDNTGAGILMSHTGGDGDWIEMESGLTQTGNFDGFMLKSFKISEYELVERNSIPMFYIDWQEIGSGNVQLMFCDGKFNRFNTTVFRIGDSANDQCSGGPLSALDGKVWKDNFVFGGSGAFEPYLQSHALNLNTTFYPSDYVTVMITIRDVSSIDNKGFQIKNFTWTNSTNWEFESGSGANMNWTARINVDQENGESGSSYANPLYANCRYEGGFEERYIDHTYDCDLGTIKAVTSPHSIITNEEDDDWQYYETNGIEATGLGFASFSANGSGFIVDNSQSQTNNLPDHYSKQFMFKQFPKSVLQQGNITVSLYGVNHPGDAEGVSAALSVMNLTSFNGTGVSFELDRWNLEQMGENTHLQAGGPSPFNYCREVLGDPSQCVIAGVDIGGNLTARDGDQNTPFDPITVTGDFSGFQTTDDIAVVFSVVDNSGTGSGTVIWQNLTVGLVTYNFANSTIKNELGENQFERITAEDPLDYQVYQGTLGSDRGLITPGSLIVEPPLPPTNLNATADIFDVILEWDESAGTTDYKIERADEGWDVSELAFVQTQDCNFGDDSCVPEDLFFRADGLKMYVADRDGPNPSIQEYDLTQAWNVTSAVFVQDFFTNVAAGGTEISPYFIQFSSNGTKMFYGGQGDDDIKEFTLSTAWDISTATLINEEDISGTSVTTRGAWFKPDGTKIFTTELIGTNLNEFSLTNPFDVSTLSAATTTSIPSMTHDPESIVVRSDGLKMWIHGEGIPEKVFEYDLGVAWDSTTMSFVQSYDVDTSVETVGKGMFVRDDGLKAFLSSSDGNGEIHEFDLNATNFSVIVPSLANEFIGVVSEDFSSYPDNATGDLTWIPQITQCQAGSGGANNFCGVNATSDTLVTKWSSSGANRITYDVFANHGINITDSSGNGNFSLTWKHLEDPLTSVSGTQYLMMVSDETTGSNDAQNCVTFRHLGSISPTNVQGSLVVRDNNVCNSGFEDIDSNVEAGDADSDQFRYVNMTKAGDDITTQYHSCEERTPACLVSSLSYTLSGEILSDLRYIKVAALASGSSSTDYIFNYDDIELSINGQSLTLYRDKTVDLGTFYQYIVRALNTVFSTESDPSNTASVLTNDVPENVTGIESTFATANQIDVQWDALAFNSGEGQASTGLNLTKYQVFRENVTAGTPFELITEVFASSPPNNFYNDTTIKFPDVFNYQVSGCNAVGCGGNSTTTQASVTDPPGAVLDTPVFNATAVDNTVSLDWNDATFSINYTVLRNSTIIAQGVPTSDYIDTTQALNTNYVYSAWGVNNNGNGTEGFSNAVITNDVPTEPINFTVSMGLVSPYLETPILNWTYPLDQGDGNPSTSVPVINFTVERKQGLGAFSFLKNETYALQNGTTDDTAVVSANYTWKVQACNVIGCSPFSNTDSLIVTPTTVPNQVPSLTADTLSGTEIFLDWVTPSFNASNQPTEYRIQQRHVGFTGFVTIADTGNLDTEYTVTGLLPGNTYDYRVAGLSGAGQGPFSPIAQNTTFTVPSPPLNLQADTLSQTSIFLDWDVPASTNGNITKYEIERESPVGAGFSKIAEISIATTYNETNDLMGRASTALSISASCSTSILGFFGDDIHPLVARSATNGQCHRGAIEWDISSIPDNAVITDVRYSFDKIQAVSARPCDVYSIEFQPSNHTGSGDDTMWFDIANGTQYLSSSSFCSGTGTGIVDLGTLADTNLQASLVNDWWAIGVKYDSEVRDSVNRFNQWDDTESRLIVTYEVPTTLNTEYTDTGLTTKTQYNYRVNATNEIGTSAYSNQAANTTFGVPDPPINLAGSTNGINEVTVEWDQPLLNYGSAVTGYRIDQAQGIGGTWITAINNTGNNIEPLEETFVGLLPQTDYVFRIFAYNGFGISPASANLTQGTIIGPSEPQNVFAVFNSTKPYSVFISWETPLSDGGKAISGYLVERKNTLGIFQQIANITDPSILNYTDTGLLNLATHSYRVAAYSNPTGSFSPDQDVTTVVPANIVNFTINDFEVVGDVIKQDYEFIVDDCFPACTLTQADIERNGIIESNIPFNTPVPLDSTITFTTWFILPDTSLSALNTTAFVTNLGSSEDDEAGVTLATAEFLVPSSLFFNHTRTTDFEFVNFTLIRHPVTWDATCEYQNGAGFGVDSSPFGQAGIQPPISLQNVGFYNDQLDVVPSLNTYVACFDPIDNQILSFTSFGLGNGSLALVSFTSQLGDFMGVPVPFIFIIFLAAIWTGRSASTGIIFLAVAIGAMGVLGYFPGLDDQPLLAGTFWSLIVLLTALGVLVGKRFF